MVEQTGVWGKIKTIPKTLAFATEELYKKVMNAREERKQYETALAAVKFIYEKGARELKQA